ncbi:hypothetical protein GCM10020220_080510 [Nonomuraea rubra]|uniref:hypothetical protein n=1 Tax=Nonomuraea rubra TaxID=46180 RepID=UPI0031EECCAF
MRSWRNGRLSGELPDRGAAAGRAGRQMIGQELGVLERLHRRCQVFDRPLVEARGCPGRTPGDRARFSPDRSTRARSWPGRAARLGTTEIARLLFGADHASTGARSRCSADAAVVCVTAASRRWTQKIAFLLGNRKADGLSPDLTVRENIILALQATRGWTRPVPAASSRTSWCPGTSRRSRSARPTPSTWCEPQRGNQQKVGLAQVA